jgi:uncharacterized circularly permuted ATP-grasp superfamily protein/uncharacterized alpha-E superfamily protein
MPSGLLNAYACEPGRFDEMCEARGQPRPAWAHFAQRLESLSDEALFQRARFVRDAIESDGVTYNVYADPKGTRRPWGLDMLPTILGAEEWARISRAVAQRARLLNALLADLYGPQIALQEGLLPSALVFGQRGYQWPALGANPPGQCWLATYAADLTRSPDGRWWVIADRTQGPSGMGYALQNRITISRTFPDAFRQLHIQPLAGFFRALQDGLARLSPCESGEAPLTVLLTPGPYNETYFEHAFLARYLGFPLVEGQDLTVRRETVYLKTLRGLRRVHAIVRRLDDDFCDPLELRSDSALGVPGLMSAMRAGRVLMANALGSGVLESAAMFGFLPALCQRLLGEALLMPSVATWWCGEPPALEYVIEHLDELVIKPAFPSMQMEAMFGHEIRGESRRRLIERLRAQPHAYVGQEWVRLSQTPVWQPSARKRLTPRSLGLRVFAAASPEGYTVMPGALGRVAPRSGVEVISMQRGGLSKDLWVPAQAPVVRTSLLKRRLGVDDLVRGGVDIPSRVGENLFWLGRYAERAEACSRVLRAALSRVASADTDSEQSLQGLWQAARLMGLLGPEAPESLPENSEPCWLAAVAHPENHWALSGILRALSFAASQVRERLSSDNWHALNRLEQLTQNPIESVDQALRALDHVMLSCISLAGFAMDDMTRDEGWRFLILGRRIERLYGLSELIALPMALPAERRERMLEWLLEAANAIVTYRARYRRVPELLPVVHLLVFDPTNPHALAFQIEALQRYLGRTARELGHPYPSLLIDPLARAVQHFALGRFEEDPPEAATKLLEQLLQQACDSATELSDEIHRRFFTHTVNPMHLKSRT